MEIIPNFAVRDIRKIITTFIKNIIIIIASVIRTRKVIKIDVVIIFIVIITIFTYDTLTFIQYHRYMPKNIPGAAALQRLNLNLFYSVSKFQRKSSMTSKILIPVRKYLVKLVLKSIANFRRFQKYDNEKNLTKVYHDPEQI